MEDNPKNTNTHGTQTQPPISDGSGSNQTAMVARIVRRRLRSEIEDEQQLGSNNKGEQNTRMWSVDFQCLMTIWERQI